MAEAKKEKGRKPSRPVTAAAIENAALHYLGRFASSSANLRRILLRKVARGAADGETVVGARLVDELIARYQKSGLLDDRAYATQTAGSLARRGASRFAIGGKLARKGVPAELVKEAIKELGEGGASEIAAACALVRRRRLGPYRSEEKRAGARQKDVAALARAGFSLDIARRVLAVRDIADLEILARDPEAS